MKSCDVQKGVVGYLDPLRHIMVPNVYWGLFRYELDLCALEERGMFAKEIEIKISKSDLRRDLEKEHGHRNSWIKYLYFAMPDAMRDCADLVPERAGIYLVSEKKLRNGYGSVYDVEVLRKAKANPDAKKWTTEMAFRLARLSNTRYWQSQKKIQHLYQVNSDLEQQIQELKS